MSKLSTQKFSTHISTLICNQRSFCTILCAVKPYCGNVCLFITIVCEYYAVEWHVTIHNKKKNNNSIAFRYVTLREISFEPIVCSHKWDTHDIWTYQVANNYVLITYRPPTHHLFNT